MPTILDGVTENNFNSNDSTRFPTLPRTRDAKRFTAAWRSLNFFFAGRTDARYELPPDNNRYRVDFPARPSFAHLLSNSTVYGECCRYRFTIDCFARPWPIRNKIYQVLTRFLNDIAAIATIAALFASKFVCPASVKRRTENAYVLMGGGV